MTNNPPSFEYIKYTDLTNHWITPNSDRARFLRSNVIDRMFPKLQISDRDLLMSGLLALINWIAVKWGFYAGEGNTEYTGEENKEYTGRNKEYTGRNKEYTRIIGDSNNRLWNQLCQNDFLDLKAILEMSLPYMNDTDGSKRRVLGTLREIYTRTDENGFMYSNSQYNRCVLHEERQEAGIVNYYAFARPFIHDYYFHNLRLLFESIESSAHKLFINWMDVLPMTLSGYKTHPLYLASKDKFSGEKPQQIILLDGWLDPSYGLSYRDFYNTISNHFFHEIKDHKWLIYDLIQDRSGGLSNGPKPVIELLSERFNLDLMWNGQLWNQLGESSQAVFGSKWREILSSDKTIDQAIAFYVYQFFKNHRNVRKLLELGLFVLTPAEQDRLDEDDIDDEEKQITVKDLLDARRGLDRVPNEEIYIFLLDQLTAFKSSWYYFAYKQIKQGRMLLPSGPKFRVTLKNIYNYSKSMISFIRDDEKKSYLQMPRMWQSLRPQEVEVVIVRMLDVFHPEWNDWRKYNWFSISRYLARVYDISGLDLTVINKEMHDLIRSRILDCVFESLIVHGLLCDFIPEPRLTDERRISMAVNIRNEQAKNNHLHSEMSKLHFESGSYAHDAYYFLINEPFNTLPMVVTEAGTQTYFQYMVSPAQNWTTTYAVNWISQINFYHRYSNNRVIYVTGGTGVGKSSQIPKLVMYSQYMLDFNPIGKTICTQPRIQPTYETAETISSQMGVSIRAYDSRYKSYISTDQFAIQFQYKGRSHVQNSLKGFLRIVTDGTLLQVMKSSAFMTRTTPLKISDAEDQPVPWAVSFGRQNLFDVIIVDEAHEHGPNMDMILTLARDAVYVNNSLKLIIVSATMDQDEALYRRYYRRINDNRLYPLNAMIQTNVLDRANVDRRVHISPPGQTTQHKITEHFMKPSELETIDPDTYVEIATQKAIEVANKTDKGNILVFLAGARDIKESVLKINKAIPPDTIALAFYRELDEERKEFISKIRETLPKYTRYKEDIDKAESEITRTVPMGTYKRAIIVATNIAEASITIHNLRYVVDTGYANVSVYDPVDDIAILKLASISRSSSQQRKGRVGRNAPGEVYYLYDVKKVLKNKTPYQIANADIGNLIVSLLISDNRDTRIVTEFNDPNRYEIYKNLPKKLQGYRYTNRELYLYQLFGNPYPLIRLIQSRYLSIPVLDDPGQLYTYFGKFIGGDMLKQRNNMLSRLKNERANKLGLIETTDSDFMNYITQCHDEYDFSGKSYRYYTGYDAEALQDSRYEFYLIHPDENIIKRNPFTGRMTGLRVSDWVTPEYYYFSLKLNHIDLSRSETEMETLLQHRFHNWKFLKYQMAVNKAIKQLLINRGVPTMPAIIFPNKRGVSNLENFIDYVNEYVQETGEEFLNRDVLTTSVIYNNLTKVSNSMPTFVLGSAEDLMWYAYGLPHGVEIGIMGLIVMLKTVPEFTGWVSDSKNLEKFIQVNRDSQGDIHFLWRLYLAIMDMLKKVKIDLTISPEMKSQFEITKAAYIAKSTINLDLNSYKIFSIMDRQGQLNGKHEFYYYVQNVKKDYNWLFFYPKFMHQLEIIASKFAISPEKLFLVIESMCRAIFEVNQGIWLYQYMIKHSLSDRDETEQDMIEWARHYLNFPSIFGDRMPDNLDIAIKDRARYFETHQLNQERENSRIWLHILEAYLRVYSVNLVSNQNSYYLRTSSATRIDPAFPFKSDIELTLMTSKPEFIVYHTLNNRGKKTKIEYLTPVELKWIYNLNPVMFLSLFKSEKESGPEPDAYDRINAVTLQWAKKVFNKDWLIYFIDRIRIPSLSESLRRMIAAVVQ